MLYGISVWNRFDKHPFLITLIKDIYRHISDLGPSDLVANNRTTGGELNGSDDQQFDARPKGLRFDHDMIVEDKFHTGTK